MKAAEYLSLVRELPIVPPDELLGRSPFVVIAPHPDDESLGTGGLIAAARSQGKDAHIVILTDGAGSHSGSAIYPHSRLIELRRAEAERAACQLGVRSACLHHFGLPDTQAPSSGPLFSEAAMRLVSLIDDIGAGTLFATWMGDPHCDHQAAALLAKEVCRQRPGVQLWAFPIWGWHLEAGSEVDQPPPTGVRLDICAHQVAKRFAIDAHVSQMTDLISDDPNGFRFTTATLAPFLGPYEFFLRVNQ